MGVFGNSDIENIKKRYLKIRNDVYDSLQFYGYCAEVDSINYKNSSSKFEYLAYLAIKDAYNAYINDVSFSQELDKRHSGINKKWVDINSSGINIEVACREFDELAFRAREHFTNRHNHIHNPEENFPLEDDRAGTNAGANETERIAAQIIAKAQDDAENIKASAARAAQELINKAEAHAKAIEDACEARKAKLIEEGNIHKNALIEEGNAQKNAFIKEGMAQKQALIEEGKAERQSLIKNIAEDNYREGLEKCVKEHFKQEQLEEQVVRETLNNEYDSIVKEKNDMLDGLHEDVQKLHSSVMLSIDDALSDFKNIQNDIHNQINSWQKNLYKNELKGLADCFMNLDKIVMSMENKIANHLSYGEEGGHKEIADELSQCVKNLKILKNNFELGLARNSIKLLIPKVGDTFNSYYHCGINIDPMTESEDVFNGKTITAVNNAGIVRELNSSDDIIQRAFVTVEK